MGKIVFIESNTTGSGKIFIEKALSKNLEVIFLTQNPKKYSFLTCLNIHPIIIDTRNISDIMLFLKKIENIKGIFSTSEYFIHIASQVAESLNLFSAPSLSVQTCRNKYAMYKSLLKAGISVPCTETISNMTEALEHSQSLSFPVVMKPVSGSGSVGVKLCQNRAIFLDHARYLLNEKSCDQLIFQEYIDGDEYSVECICREGSYDILGITKKYLGPEPFFVEIGHDFPASLDAELKKNIIDACKKSLDAIGLTRGIAHIELRIQNNIPFIIEINPRLAGGMIPQLVSKSIQLDLFDTVLELYLGSPAIISPPKEIIFSVIRFLIPKVGGILKDIRTQPLPPDVKDFSMIGLFKKIGDNITIQGDFNDRLGYVLVSSHSLENAVQKANILLGHIKYVIETVTVQGQEKKSIPEIQEILDRGISLNRIRRELVHLTAINEAHLIMLLKCGLLSERVVLQLLEKVEQIAEEDFKAILGHSYQRGVYWHYESFLIESLGMEIGGSIHLARSRNDINATIFNLFLRDAYKEIYAVLWELRSVILQKASQSQNVEMPCYSQFQPAFPATYAHYLLAVAEALHRDQGALQDLYQQLNTSHLGTGAGGGTSFPIDMSLSSNLLGFTKISINALDSVASRDLALRFLSVLTILGTLIGRIAQDFQLWTTQEFSFFTLPEELCGISSMMPQKKNPYLLEKIKGKMANLTGHFMGSLMAMQKTPFSNSVEVGTEALADFNQAINLIKDGMTILKFIIQEAQPISKNMTKSSYNGAVIATSVSDMLVREKRVPFRDAYLSVSHTLKNSLDKNEDPVSAILKLLPDPYHEKKDGKYWRKTLEYGAGPGDKSSELCLDQSITFLQKDGQWFQKKINLWKQSEELRKKEVENFFHSVFKKSF